MAFACSFQRNDALYLKEVIEYRGVGDYSLQLYLVFCDSKLIFVKFFLIQSK
jgi:hypothetical protein